MGGLFGSGSVPADSTVSLTVAGAISGTGSAGSVYAGGAMGNGSVYSPITVIFENSAAVTAKNTGGAADSGGLIGYFASGSVDLRGSKLVNNTSNTVNITSEASSRHEIISLAFGIRVMAVILASSEWVRLPLAVVDKLSPLA